MPLTDLAIKKLAPKEKPFRVSDEKGLVLQVQPNGSKYWQFRYRFREKEKLLSLGVYPELTLARARAKRDDARKLLAEGVDPSAAKKQKRADEQANLFSAVANAWYEFHRPRWAKKTADKCRSCLDNDILPVLPHQAGPCGSHPKGAKLLHFTFHSRTENRDLSGKRAQLPTNGLLAQAERTKASIRARVEHPFSLSRLGEKQQSAASASGLPICCSAKNIYGARSQSARRRCNRPSAEKTAMPENSYSTK